MGYKNRKKLICSFIRHDGLFLLRLIQIHREIAQLLTERLYWSARKMKTAGLRRQHPDWPEPRLKDEVRRIFSHART